MMFSSRTQKKQMPLYALTPTPVLQDDWQGFLSRNVNHAKVVLMRSCVMLSCGNRHDMLGNQVICL